MNAGKIPKQMLHCSHEKEVQMDIQWRDGRKIWDHNRPPGLIIVMKKRKVK